MMSRFLRFGFAAVIGALAGGGAYGAEFDLRNPAIEAYDGGTQMGITVDGLGLTLSVGTQSAVLNLGPAGFGVGAFDDPETPGHQRLDGTESIFLTFSDSVEWVSVTLSGQGGDDCVLLFTGEDEYASLCGSGAETSLEGTVIPAGHTVELRAFGMGSASIDRISVNPVNAPTPPDAPPDSDGDGVVDGNDPEPNNVAVCGDSDDDGCDDCARRFHVSPEDDGPDFDGDGLCDSSDPDLDNDSVPNESDPDPNSRFVCGDSDADGCDDCNETGGPPDATNDGVDADGDGQCDALTQPVRTSVWLSIAPASVAETLDVNFGDTITLFVRAGNEGPGVATGLQVITRFPEGVEIVGFAAPPGTVYDPGARLWSIGTLGDIGHALIQPLESVLRLDLRFGPGVPESAHLEAEVFAVNQPDLGSTPNNADEEPLEADTRFFDITVHRQGDLQPPGAQDLLLAFLASLCGGGSPLALVATFATVGGVKARRRAITRSTKSKARNSSR